MGCKWGATKAHKAGDVEVVKDPSEILHHDIGRVDDSGHVMKLEDISGYSFLNSKQLYIDVAGAVCLLAGVGHHDSGLVVAATWSCGGLGDTEFNM